VKMNEVHRLSKMKKIFLFLIFLGLILPIGAMGDVINIPNPLNANEFEEIVNNIIDFLFEIAIVLAPLMIVVGAVLLVASGGNLAQTERAKNIILWTAVGFFILLLAKGIMALIESILGIE